MARPATPSPGCLSARTNSGTRRRSIISGAPASTTTRPDQAGEEVGRRLAVATGAAGLPGFRFHDLRHTVVTDLLEAGEPEHVIQAVTGQLSKKMLEHYSHQRLKAKGQMLARMGYGGRRERPSTLYPVAFMVSDYVDSHLRR